MADYVVTSTLGINPDATGDYTQNGTYNGQPAYERGDRVAPSPILTLGGSGAVPWTFGSLAAGGRGFLRTNRREGR